MLQELENVKVEGVNPEEEILKTKVRFGSKGLTIWAQSKKLEEFFKARSNGQTRETYTDQNGGSKAKIYKNQLIEVNDSPGATIYSSEPLYWLVNGSRYNFGFLLCEGLGDGVAITINAPITKSDFDKWVANLKLAVKSIVLNYLQEYEVDLIMYEKVGRR